MAVLVRKCSRQALAGPQVPGAAPSPPECSQSGSSNMPVYIITEEFILHKKKIITSVAASLAD